VTSSRPTITARVTFCIAKHVRAPKSSRITAAFKSSTYITERLILSIHLNDVQSRSEQTDLRAFTISSIAAPAEGYLARTSLLASHYKLMALSSSLFSVIDAI